MCDPNFDFLVLVLIDVEFRADYFSYKYQSHPILSTLTLRITRNAHKDLWKVITELKRRRMTLIFK